MFFGSEYDQLFLEQLSDTPDNELIIIISHTKRIKPTADTLKDEENEKIRELLSKAVQIVPDGAQTYRIYFADYIMYQGRTESYCSPVYDNAGEIGTGKGLVLFEKSKLLDYVNDITDISLAMHMHSKTKLHHYGIYTLNNIIDVITFYEPVIEKVS